MVAGKSVLTGATTQYVVMKVSTNAVLVDFVMVASLGTAGHKKRHGFQAADITIAAQRGRKGERVTMPPGEAQNQKIPCRLKRGAGIPETRTGTCPCFLYTLVPR